MLRLTAAWILPIAAPPIRDGWVDVDGDRVVACGSAASVKSSADRSREIDLGDVAILPGLVNAHTHLELSWLRDQVPRGASFVSWIRAVMSARSAQPAPDAPQILDGVSQGIAEAIRAGTAVVGDISNTLVTLRSLGESPLASVVFYELIGFNRADPEGIVAGARGAIRDVARAPTLRASLAAHAPYSVAPAMLRAIASAVADDPVRTCSVHLCESAEEIEFIRAGGGPWKQLLEDVGAWNAEWTAPATTPVEYLDAQRFLGDHLLAVHAVHATEADLGTLAARRTTVVTCPRSNLYTGAGTPPIRRFYRSGVTVAVGTDSLASTPDLNLFAELAEMHALAPDVPAGLVLESATRSGARALGFDGDYGSIEPGKRARLLAVAVPPSVDDVEEYLVSGIDPQQLRWVPDALT